LPDIQSATTCHLSQHPSEAGDQTEADFALFTLGYLQLVTRSSDSLMNLEESLASYSNLGVSFYEIRVVDMISAFYLFRGELEERVRIARLRLELANKIGDRLTAADALAQIGFVAEITGRYVEAEYNYKGAIPIFGEYGDRYHKSECSSFLGMLTFLKGELSRARILVTEAMELARQFNQNLSMRFARGTLGIILCAEEKYEQAVELCQDPALTDFWSGAFVGLRGMAYAMCGLGDFAAARDHLSNAVEMAVTVKATGWQVQCLPAAALIADSENQLEGAVELLALAFHHPAATGWLGIFPLVTRLRTRLETELSPQVFAQDWERGVALDLDETIAALLPDDLDESSASD